MARPRNPSRVVAIGALALVPCAAARGQSAYFSAVGTFSTPSGQAHNFHFGIPSTSNMLFRTWAHGGGTNAAGQSVPPGGIDSILKLYTSGGGLIDENDDIGPGQRDSRIVAAALSPGAYRLEMTNFKTAAGNGAWAVDLVNNSGDLALTSAVGSANSTMHTLSFGAESGALATLPLSAGASPVVSSALNVQSGGVVNITGMGTVTFGGGFNAATGGGIVIPAGVTARFTGAVNGLGAFSGGGTKRFEANASGGNLATSGSTIVAAGATLTANHVRESSLSIDGSVVIVPSGTDAGTSRVNTLALGGGTGAWTGRLDLSNNALVIDYPAGNSPLATVRDQIRFAATSAGAGGVLTSSGATYGVGYAEAAALGTVPPIFGAVDADALLVRGTRLGDANLDGTVNLADFNRLASNFGSTGAVWIEGDFTHDGLVNLADFNRLAANFGLSAAGPEVTPQDWSNLAAAVPEPATTGVVAALACALAPRRRRR